MYTLDMANIIDNYITCSFQGRSGGGGGGRIGLNQQLYHFKVTSLLVWKIENLFLLI